MRQTIQVPMNRVEGDLEIKVELEDNVVTQAWCAGTMYRGFERIMLGRGALDGLVLTPRICGICSTAHLTAAALALDHIAGALVPPDAVRVRNLALMAELLQSDLRHTFLMFAVDLINPRFRQHPMWEEAVGRWAPLRGTTAVEVLEQSKKLLEIVAIVGGQWPHTSFIVPGGIASVPSSAALQQCKHLLRCYRQWFERVVLGCSLERWQSVRSHGELSAWLEERSQQRDSELGFLWRYARKLELESWGRGSGRFLSFGALDLPIDTKLRVPMGARQLILSGMAEGSAVQPFEVAKVTEDLRYSWLGENERQHPSVGETRPYASGEEGEKYSWAKAPRYAGKVVETGPLAEAVVAQSPLIVDLLDREGPSVLLRVLSRLVRTVDMIPAMEMWLSEAGKHKDVYYVKPPDFTSGVGFGLTHAARGALGHWLRLEDRRIAHYQIITPTAWNASPRDNEGQAGAMEQALIGTRVEDASDPVELGVIARSFDPCLVCTVHTLRRNQVLGRVRIG
ncbi:MAG: nickel-dependent hydrogenase large subunit [Myxococcota bacterium]|jgi:hydrogenase large subunit|nr:nickel-dependent hydrogenase large subunit [Myxococcota bacterium]